jgi:hypothetical protein
MLFAVGRSSISIFRALVPFKPIAFVAELELQKLAKQAISFAKLLRDSF